MSVTTKKKHVERELYEDFTLPGEHQTIVQVVRPRGNNLHQVATADGEEFLVSMPHKFRKHVWIKRGDFVVTEPIPEGNKVRAEIVRILLKDHIRYLAQNSMWPKAFAQQMEDEKGTRNESKEAGRSERDSERGSDSESDSDSDDLLMENPNRQRVCYEESSESDSEDDYDDDDEDEEDEDGSLTEDTNRLRVRAKDSDDGDDEDGSLIEETNRLRVMSKDSSDTDGKDSPKEND